MGMTERTSADQAYAYLGIARIPLIDCIHRDARMFGMPGLERQRDRLEGYVDRSIQRMADPQVLRKLAESTPLSLRDVVTSGAASDTLRTGFDNIAPYYDDSIADLKLGELEPDHMMSLLRVPKLAEGSIVEFLVAGRVEQATEGFANFRTLPPPLPAERKIVPPDEPARLAAHVQRLLEGDNPGFARRVVSLLQAEESRQARQAARILRMANNRPGRSGQGNEI
jgi:hypothetical protein